MSGFGKQDWKQFFLKLYAKADSTDIFNRAALVAFYFSFAFFPLLLFLITLAGLVLGTTEELRRDLFSYLYQILPRSAYTLVGTTLDEIIESSSGGKLTVGLLITLWSASAGVDTLRSSLNAVYELKETRAWWKTRAQSLILTFLFIILLAIAIVTVSAGWRMFGYLLGQVGLNIESPLFLIGIQWIALVGVLLFASETIYNWLPCHKRFRWYWITPGSVVAICLWLVFSGIFRLYLQYFNTYNKAYGSLGAMIILMLWMLLTATAVLLGGAINSVLMELMPTEDLGESTCDNDPPKTRPHDVI